MNTQKEQQELIDNLNQSLKNFTFAYGCIDQTPVMLKVSYFNQQEGINIAKGKFDKSFAAFGQDITAYIAELETELPNLPTE